MSDLPVDPAAEIDDQRYQALTFAHDQGWIAFEHVTPGPRSERRWVVSVPKLPALRELRPDAVIPYVTGLADANGKGHLFPTREDDC